MKNGIKLGETHYVGGPCPNGNVAPRRVSDRKCTCQACSRAKTVRSRERKRRHRTANAEAYAARAASWYVANRDHKSAYTRQWKAANEDRVNAYHANRRARTRNAVPAWFGELDELAVVEAMDLAQRRAQATGMPWHVDHRIPLAAREASGLHCAANLQVIPAALNLQKFNRLRFVAANEWLEAVA